MWPDPIVAAAAFAFLMTAHDDRLVPTEQASECFAEGIFHPKGTPCLQRGYDLTE